MSIKNILDIRSKKLSFLYSIGTALILILFTFFVLSINRSNTFISSVTHAATTTNITRDAKSSKASSSFFSASQLSWIHTTGSQQNKILIVGVQAVQKTSAVSVTKITYGTQSLSKLNAIKVSYSGGGSGNIEDIEMWYLLNPTAGSKTVTVTLSSKVTGWEAGAVTYYNVAQIPPTGSVTATGYGTANASVTVNNTNESQLVVDVNGNDDDGTKANVSATVGSGQTINWYQLSGSARKSNNLLASSSKPGNAESTTMSWVDLAPSDNNQLWGEIAVALNSSDNTPTVTPTMTLTPTNAPTPTATQSSTLTPSVQPIALIYDDSSTHCCANSIADAIKNDPNQNFKTILVGPKTTTTLAQGFAMQNVKLFVEPGGTGGEVKEYSAQKGNKTMIQNFVKNGGRYLGSCMGAYLAGQTSGSVWPGFDLLPAIVEEYVTTPGAETTSYDNVNITVNWGGQTRKIFFQDGPDFIINSGATGVNLLATYITGQPAAFVSPYGSGKVGVQGPHTEADQTWYTGTLPWPGSTQDLFNNLLDTLMQ
jgi:glutamine amidotransferase-like uncharacterized protein